MTFDKALREGLRIRHQNWPPFHYAELRPSQYGKPKLWRCTPHSEAKLLDVAIEDLCEDQGWALLQAAHQL